ncbi:Uncharacterised protein [Chlamydia trachomatis]|nr:Uncharacterised protein [Chlamydia trachomatis]
MFFERMVWCDRSLQQGRSLPECHDGKRGPRLERPALLLLFEILKKRVWQLFLQSRAQYPEVF